MLSNAFSGTNIQCRCTITCLRQNGKESFFKHNVFCVICINTMSCAFQQMNKNRKKKKLRICLSNHKHTKYKKIIYNGKLSCALCKREMVVIVAGIDNEHVEEKHWLANFVEKYFSGFTLYLYFFSCSVRFVRLKARLR